MSTSSPLTSKNKIRPLNLENSTLTPLPELFYLETDRDSPEKYCKENRQTE